MKAIEKQIRDEVDADLEKAKASPLPDLQVPNTKWNEDSRVLTTLFSPSS